MAIIQPFDYLESTNIKEHNQIVNKLNEVVDAINGFNPDLQTYNRATIDEKDETVLTEAKAYADTIIPTYSGYTKTEVDTKDSIVLTEAKTYADNKDVTVLNEAKAYADTKQDKLIAGNGINISGNVISAEAITSANLSTYDLTSWDDLVNAITSMTINGKAVRIYCIVPRHTLGLDPNNIISVTRIMQPDSIVFNYSYTTWGAFTGVSVFGGQRIQPRANTIGNEISIGGGIISAMETGNITYASHSVTLRASDFAILYKEV